MKTLIGFPHSTIDKGKYIRQLRFVVNWLKYNSRATCIAATGFGKSGIALIVIQKMLKNDPNKTTIIIVPTTNLKKQWENILISLNITNCSVYVINTIALNKNNYNCDLLVIDEIHKMASKEFSKLFHLIKYSWVLGLTATIQRLDGKESLLKHYAPICDELTHIECIKRKWVSDTIEINLSVPLSRKEVEEMAAIDKSIRYYMSKFGDFDTLRSCINSGKAKSYAELYYPSEDPQIKAKEIVIWAVQGSRLIKKRQEFLYNTERKVVYAETLIKELGLKTITFSQSTAFADSLHDKFKESSVVYHSNLESKVISVEKTKNYSTAAAANKLLSTTNNSKLSTKEGKYVVNWIEQKKVGKKYLTEKALELFKSPSNKIDKIFTAKALDQGADFPDAELGIEGARSTNPAQRKQRRGRISRSFIYKDGTVKRGVYISLYIPNSQDEKWLRDSQKGDSVLWMDDIDNCISFIKKNI